MRDMLESIEKRLSAARVYIAAFLVVVSGDVSLTLLNHDDVSENTQRIEMQSQEMSEIKSELYRLKYTNQTVSLIPTSVTDEPEQPSFCSCLPQPPKENVPSKLCPAYTGNCDRKSILACEEANPNHKCSAP